MGRFIQFGEQVGGPLRAFAFQNVAERFQPFLGFGRIDIDGLRRGNFLGHWSGYHVLAPLRGVEPIGFIDRSIGLGGNRFFQNLFALSSVIGRNSIAG